MSLKAGDIVRFERTFTLNDVELFIKISGGEGIHHMNLDAQGRVVIQGLLTATLPTKVGGDNNVLARHMDFEFLKPVYTGDTITCEVTIDQLEPKEKRTSIFASFRCHNQHNTLVLKGSFSGVIL
ncbi:hotdog domain-containing protein [Psychrobacillus sp. BL-248-WT-3]|uniref:hotdog domain-containing protein n=1 Tax=Psychrobacillus sp. BL-248-WT-3 TaxID=2725306 RepID=UPI001469BE7D|nr:hotdog domain-containing protein [Psychrobacillus sp. BL-248-WT-3]NME07487.1 enoyl-CoA hydratase [Psychrobacillus sp. BL-248-WT-3]